MWDSRQMKERETLGYNQATNRNKRVAGCSPTGRF
jgi:hypothetical protein